MEDIEEHMRFKKWKELPGWVGMFQRVINMRSGENQRLFFDNVRRTQKLRTFQILRRSFSRTNFQKYRNNILKRGRNKKSETIPLSV